MESNSLVGIQKNSATHRSPVSHRSLTSSLWWVDEREKIKEKLQKCYGVKMDTNFKYFKWRLAFINRGWGVLLVPGQRKE